MTRKRREPTGEELALFRAAIDHEAPLVPVQPNNPPGFVPKKTADNPPQPAPLTGTRTSGLDGRTAHRLRRGEIEPEDRLDLHGLTEAAAHRRLMEFLRASHGRGLRLVLVVTGKGTRAAADHQPVSFGEPKRGVLRAATPRWLQEPGIAPLIAATRIAHRRHGGDGALYVYLRKMRGSRP